MKIPTLSKYYHTFLGATSPLTNSQEANDNENIETVKRRSKRFLERGIAKSIQIEGGEDSSSASTPRRTRRSLRSPKKSSAGESSPTQKAKFSAEENIEVYDLTSVLQSDTTSLSMTPSLKRRENSSQYLDSASDTSDDIGEIPNIMSLRTRTISQTSATSATSTESASSFTRIKSSVTKEDCEKPTLTRSPKRRSVPAVVTNNTEKSIVEESNLFPAMTPRRSRRRATQSSDPSEPSTPKKQKVHD